METTGVAVDTGVLVWATKGILVSLRVFGLGLRAAESAGEVLAQV